MRFLISNLSGPCETATPSGGFYPGCESRRISGDNQNAGCCNVTASSCTVSPHPPYVSSYWDCSIAAREETLSVGMTSCVARSANGLVNASGAETAIHNGAN